MENNIEALKNILNNLKEDPMRVAYTEHYLNQIERRNLPDICIEEQVEKGNLKEIRHIRKNRYELHFRLDDSTDIYVILSTLNRDRIILISSSSKNNGFKNLEDNSLEFEEIYDIAFDLMDLHSKESFRFGQTVEIEPWFNIDFDTTGRPIAIEIIMASKKFKMNREVLMSSTLEGQIEIASDVIRIHLKASFENGNGNARVIEREIPNDYGIAENVFDLTFEKID